MCIRALLPLLLPYLAACSCRGPGDPDSAPPQPADSASPDSTADETGAPQETGETAETALDTGSIPDSDSGAGDPGNGVRIEEVQFAMVVFEQYSYHETVVLPNDSGDRVFFSQHTSFTDPKTGDYGATGFVGGLDWPLTGEVRIDEEQRWSVQGEGVDYLMVLATADLLGDEQQELLMGRYGAQTTEGYGEVLVFERDSLELNLGAADADLTLWDVGDGFGCVIATGPREQGRDVVGMAAKADPDETARIFYLYGGAWDGAAGPASGRIAPVEETNGFARCASWRGDHDGDGTTDLVLSSSSYDSFRGNVLVYLNIAGDEQLSDQDADARIEGESYTGLGWAFADNGDLDGDGYDDLAVVQYSSGDGRTLVYYGPMETGRALGPSDADAAITTCLAMNEDPGDDIEIGELDQDSQGAELALGGDRAQYGKVEGAVAIPGFACRTIGSITVTHQVR